MAAEKHALPALNIPLYMVIDCVSEVVQGMCRFLQILSFVLDHHKVMPAAGFALILVLRLE